MFSSTPKGKRIKLDRPQDETNNNSTQSRETSNNNSSIHCKPKDTSTLSTVLSPAAMSRHTPRLRVLSLFDGIGTGMFALSQLGFDIEVFYACEIDECALNLTQHHFGDRITQLGSVTEIDDTVLDKLGSINLLIGGSPCSDLSCVNRLRKGLYDPTGTGILFFDFYNIWNYLKLKSTRENTPFYWIFENVSGMERKNKNIISKFLKCEPCVVDSLHVSPQRRKRFFWNNLPNNETMINRILDLVNEKEPVLDDFLIKNLGRRANFDKIWTITTKRNCLNDGSSRNPVNQNGLNTGLFITELEFIFGFPFHYTDVCDFSITKRQQLLGKAWSVPVVKIIFQLLEDRFAMKDKEKKE